MSSELFKSSLANADIVVRVSGPDNFTNYDSDLEIAVEYMANDIAPSAPTLDAIMGLSCQTVNNKTIVTATTLALLTGAVIDTSNSET